MTQGIRAPRTVRGALLAALIVSAGCAARVSPPLTPPAVVDARDSRVRALQRDLAASFDQPALRRGLVAVVVRSADRGDTLFRYHDETLVMPASNMKLVTLAAAAERLGWDYTFPTTITTDAPIVDGAIAGDLVVIGTGDPSIEAHEGTPGVMDAWAETLWQMGLRRVDGRLVGDDRAFAGEGLGAGWSWDNLAWGYSAPVSALQANLDAAELRITPGAQEGDPASVVLTPGESGLVVTSGVFTGAAGSPPAVELTRRPGSSELQVTGRVPAGSPPLVRTAAVDRPTGYFLRLLSAALARRGIIVAGGAAPIGELGASGPAAGTALVRHESPPLRVLAATLMKVSQNQYAETLLRALGRTGNGSGTAEAGRAAVASVLASWGIPADALVQADGSGLSRYNYVTAGTLASILGHMYHDERHRSAWLEALAVGGVDGTLDKRFKGTRAEGLLRAKTGTISNVRSLSGYLPAANGERLLFVMVLNNVTAGRQDLDRITDGAVLRLMQFSR